VRLTAAALHWNNPRFFEVFSCRDLDEEINETKIQNVDGSVQTIQVARAHVVRRDSAPRPFELIVIQFLTMDRQMSRVTAGRSHSKKVEFNLASNVR
jgi:hypothetical protein